MRQRTHSLKENFPAVYHCSSCGSPIHPELVHLDVQIDDLTRLQLIKELEWNPTQTLCPDCVQRAATAARMNRSQTSLQDELLLPYPVYSRAEAVLLPTPIRIHASPQYAGNGVSLAFIDSGFYPHPDLTRPENRILAYVDATGDIPYERSDFNQPLATSWHGLMTASIAAGNGHLSEGVFRGTADKAKLVLVKTGNPYGRAIREVDIERALTWVVQNHERFNIRVVNISLGGDYPPRPGMLSELDCLVEEAVSLGIVVVAASGNSGVERLLPPATAPSAITVGGLDDRNSLDTNLWRMYHSNYGKSPLAQPKPELIAPAVWLAAPMLPHTKTYKEGARLWRFDHLLDTSHRLLTTGGIKRMNGILSIPRLETKRKQIRHRIIEQKFVHPHYQHVDGTSMAAPVVTSVIAQMLEANPSLSPAQVREILISTAQPLQAVDRVRQGAGVLCAARAVAAARRLTGGPLENQSFTPFLLDNQISFTYYDPTLRFQRVALIGSFNHWDPRLHELQLTAPGLWQGVIPRPPPGQYPYKFLLDVGWVSDPENPKRIEDGYGGFNSIVEVAA